jgi:hypothetical protein
MMAPKNLPVKVLRAARLLVAALTVVLVVVAVPAAYRRQHTVSVGGVSFAIEAAGEVLLTDVAPGTPAAKAGLLSGDTLLAVDGQALDKDPSPDALTERLNGWVGSTVSLTVRTGDAPPRTVAVARSPEPGSIAARLASMGVGMDAVINEMLGLDIAVLLVYLAVSFLIISRGQRAPLTYFASIALITFSAAATSSVQFLALDPSPWRPLAAALVPTGYAAAFTFLGFLYPNGKWVPRRARVLVGIVWAWTIAQWFWPPARPANWDPVAALAVYLLMIVAMFGAQLRRYRRVATPAEREQIKWFVVSLAAVVAGYAVSQIAALLVQSPGSGPGRASAVAVFILWQTSVVGYQIPYALMAVALGLALLKHRLWDIDIVINQSLVYSALTAALAVLSAAVLAVMTTLIGRIFGNVSKLLAVAATAAFPVAAFNPLRQRIQRLVDRKTKPEEVSFAETSSLLGLEVQALLTPGEMMGTLVRAVAGQLDLASAAAYAPTDEGGLALAEETPAGAGWPRELAVDGPGLDGLRLGRLVPMPGGSGFSVLVPLTTSRTLGHAFCGVLALGPRRSGRGYTTPMEQGLRQLGIEAGKALYVARLRESRLKG